MLTCVASAFVQILQCWFHFFVNTYNYDVDKLTEGHRDRQRETDVLGVQN